MSRKAPTPVRTIPSSGFVDTMAASQQTHIDQLVQQNRTLQTTVKKLKDELAAELARGKAAVQSLHQQQQAERSQWEEGCDTILACHRLIHLRSAAALDKERLNVLNEQDNLRKERLARLQRDFNLTMFQQREAQLERRIWELEDELEDARTDIEEALLRKEIEIQTAVKTWKKEYSGSAAELAIRTAELDSVQAERDQIQEELNTLRESFSHLEAKSQSQASRLERTSLQLEGAQTAKTELQQKVDELSLTVTDLKRQLDKWQHLETRGGQEVDSLRKARVELEVRVKQLEAQLEQSSAFQEECERALDKEKRKVEKAKGAIREWMEDAQAKQSEVDQLADQVAKLEEHSAQLQNQVEKLKAGSEMEPATIQSSRQMKSPRKRQPSPDLSEVAVEEVADVLEVDGAVLEESTPPAASNQKKPRAPRKPSSAKPARPIARRLEVPSVEIVVASPESGDKGKRKAKAVSPVEEENAVELEYDEAEQEVMEEPIIVPVKTARPRGKGKAKAAAEDDNEVEVLEDPKPKGKGKGKAKAEEALDSGVEEVGSQDAPKVRKGKRKVPDDDDDSAEAPAVKAQPRARGRPPRSRSTVIDDPPKGSRSRKQAASRTTEETAKSGGRRPTATDEKSDSEEPIEDRQPKKKRKINIFGTTAQSTAFDFLAPGQDGGLNIPTDLSPVKVSENIPSRSNSGMLSLIGSKLASAFTPR